MKPQPDWDGKASTALDRLPIAAIWKKEDELTSTRQRVNRRYNRGKVVMISGLPIAIVSGALIALIGQVMIIGVAFGALCFFAGLLFANSGGTCIRCGRPLNGLFSQAMSSVDRLPHEIHFCPFCGTSLDELFRVRDKKPESQLP